MLMKIARKNRKTNVNKFFSSNTFSQIQGRVEWSGYLNRACKEKKQVGSYTFPNYIYKVKKWKCKNKKATHLQSKTKPKTFVTLLNKKSFTFEEVCLWLKLLIKTSKSKNADFRCVECGLINTYIYLFLFQCWLRDTQYNNTYIIFFI